MLGNQLIRAVELGSLHKVNELLEQGAAVNFHNSVGNTPLTTAVYFGFDDVFDRLLQQPGIDFDMPDVVCMHCYDTSLYLTYWLAVFEPVRCVLSRIAACMLRSAVPMSSPHVFSS